MALKHWHLGKLVMFWVFWLLGGLFLLGAAERFRPGSDVLGLVVLIVPFVVTWKWFTAREKRD